MPFHPSVNLSPTYTEFSKSQPFFSGHSCIRANHAGTLAAHDSCHASLARLRVQLADSCSLTLS